MLLPRDRGVDDAERLDVALQQGECPADLADVVAVAGLLAPAPAPDPTRQERTRLAMLAEYDRAGRLGRIDRPQDTGAVDLHLRQHRDSAGRVVVAGIEAIDDEAAALAAAKLARLAAGRAARERLERPVR